MDKFIKAYRPKHHNKVGINKQFQLEVLRHLSDTCIVRQLLYLMLSTILLLFII